MQIALALEARLHERQMIDERDLPPAIGSHLLGGCSMQRGLCVFQRDAPQLRIAADGLTLERGQAGAPVGMNQVEFGLSVRRLGWHGAGQGDGWNVILAPDGYGRLIVACFRFHGPRTLAFPLHYYKSNGSADPGPRYTS